MGDVTTLGPTLPPLDGLRAKWKGMSWAELLPDALGNVNRSLEAHYVSLNQLAYIDDAQRWKEDGRYVSFGEFLYGQFNLQETKFRRWRLLAASFEQRDYDRWGVERLAQVVRAANPPACLTALNEAWEEEQRRPPRKRIKAIIREHQPPALPAPKAPVIEDPEVLRRALAKQEAENRRLRQRLAQQERDNKALRDQIDTMRADIRDHYQRIGRPPEAAPPAPA